jgi:hypothetical protein
MIHAWNMPEERADAEENQGSQRVGAIQGSRKFFMIKLMKEDGRFSTTQLKLRRRPCSCADCQQANFCEQNWIIKKFKGYVI